MGEKRVLGDAGCMLPLILGGPQCFGLAFHSVVTLRMSWYAPPDTVGIRFVTSFCRISAINRRCGPDSLVCTFLRGSLLCLPRPYKRQRPQWLPLIGEGLFAAAGCRTAIFAPALFFPVKIVYNTRQNGGVRRFGAGCIVGGNPTR